MALARAAVAAVTVGYTSKQIQCWDDKFIWGVGGVATGLALGAVITKQVSTPSPDAHQLPKRIVIVRHAASEGNADITLYQEKPDNAIRITTSPGAYFLSRYGEEKAPRFGDNGTAQALHAGKRVNEMTGEDPIFMFHSPYTRTSQTAMLIRKSIEARVVRSWPDARLREQELGNLQDQRHANEYRKEQQKVGRFFYRFPDGESGCDVFDRASNWWQSMVTTPFNKLDSKSASQWSDSTVVVVTHGITMRMILMQLYDWSPNTFHSIWNAPNCGMVVLDRDPTYHRHYRINKELSDPIKSSINFKITLKAKAGRKTEMIFSFEGESDDRGLQNWLEVPQPRLHQLSHVKRMIFEQYGEKHGFVEQDIEKVQGYGAFAGKTLAGARGEEANDPDNRLSCFN